MSIIAEENKAGKIIDGDMKQMITHNFCLPFSHHLNHKAHTSFKILLWPVYEDYL
jgi:hypothetical protein